MSFEAYEKVKLARDNKRPTAVSYIRAIFTELFEMRGDRRFADDAAVLSGFSKCEHTVFTFELVTL